MELDDQLREYAQCPRESLGEERKTDLVVPQPDYRELRAYFDHVDKVVGIKKDCSFHTVVTGATFDKDAGKWTVTTADGRTSKTRFLILGSGFVSIKISSGSREFG